MSQFFLRTIHQCLQQCGDDQDVGTILLFRVLSAVNERQLIEYLTTFITPDTKGLIRGIGDDCAVIQKDDHLVWLLTMDTLVEGVHFDAAFHSPDKLGRKIVSVNISDIAAMAGKPMFMLLSIGMPAGFDATWFKSFVRGIMDACHEYGCQLIGGDTVANPNGLVCSLTVIGEAAPDLVVYRHGARPGDTVWVSGSLGFAAAGLALLQRTFEPHNRRWQPFREQHLDPVARVEVGQKLGASGLVHAMMDLSDGLATDLAHLCRQSGVGAKISFQALPGIGALKEVADAIGGDPEEWAVRGGDDYELLFTTAADAGDQLLAIGSSCGLQLSPVGTIVAGREVTLIRTQADGTQEEKVITYQGFDHFREKDEG